MDAPPFCSVEQLVELAGDREGWRERVWALLPDKGRKKKRKKGGEV